MNEEKNVNQSKEIEYWSGNTITELNKNEIFVFGSNPSGIHGAGAAKAAVLFGAKYGEGRGLFGNTYALVTKNLKENYFERSTKTFYHNTGYKSLTEEQIRANIKEMYDLARQPEHQDKKFLITYQYETWPNGSPKKSLNGYTSQEILNMFAKDQDIPANIVFHDSYKAPLEKILKIENNKSEAFSYSKEILKDNQPRENFTFFWHSPSPFSQWHPSLFNVKGFTFTSGEQFMMFCKAKVFKDDNVAQKLLHLNEKEGSILKKFIDKEVSREDILKNPTYKKEWESLQKEIKKLGREVRNYNDTVWVQKREGYVARGNYEKFTQNPELKESLLNTKGTIMAESNYFDKIWAIGIKESDQNATSPSKWKGLNLLGKILTNLRESFILQLNNEQENKVEEKEQKKVEKNKPKSKP